VREHNTITAYVLKQLIENQFNMLVKCVQLSIPIEHNINSKHTYILWTLRDDGSMSGLYFVQKTI